MEKKKREGRLRKEGVGRQIKRTWGIREGCADGSLHS